MPPTPIKAKRVAQELQKRVEKILKKAIRGGTSIFKHKLFLDRLDLACKIVFNELPNRIKKMAILKMIDMKKLIIFVGETMNIKLVM